MLAIVAYLIGVCGVAVVWWLIEVEIDVRLALGPLGENPALRRGPRVQIALALLASAMIVLGLTPFYGWSRPIYAAIPLAVVVGLAVVGALAQAAGSTRIVTLHHARSTDPETRAIGLRKLARLPGADADARVRELLLANLEAERFDLTAAAAQGLEAIGAGELAVVRLTNGLRSAETAEHRLALELALTSLGPGSQPALIRALSDPGAPVQVRRGAARALGEMREPNAAVALSRALGDAEPAVRAAAAHGLGRHCFEPAVPRLQELAVEGSGEVRLAAVDALARIATPAVRDALVASVHDELEMIRSIAYEGLVEMDGAPGAGAQGLVAFHHRTLWTAPHSRRLEALKALRARGYEARTKEEQALVALVDGDFPAAAALGAAAVGPLRVAARDLDQAEASLGRLVELLTREAAAIPTPHLEALARLEGIRARPVDFVERPLDSSAVRRLARAELEARRAVADPRSSS